MKNQFIFLILCVFSLCLGCSSDSGSRGLVPAEGTVTFEGKPVENASILFYPTEKDSPAAMGTTDKTGRFSLMSFEPGDGAKPGEYIATVMKMETRGEIHIFRPEGTNQKIVQDEREIIHHLPQQYACPSSTHLKITIPGNGDSNLVIDLTGEADLTPRQAKTMDRRIDPRDWGT